MGYVIHCITLTLIKYLVLLTGIYLILFFMALFLYRQRKGKVNRKHQCISLAMFWLFGVATAHFVRSNEEIKRLV